MTLAVLHGLLGEMLAPSRCAACEMPARAPFCAACAPSLIVDDGPRGRHVAAFEYGGALAEAIMRFKYGGDVSLGPTLGRLACTALPRLSSNIDAVTHVPLHPRRLAERGFDQAALIGAQIAGALSVPMLYGALNRSRDTPRQALLGRRDRLANVASAFSANAPKRRISGLSVLIVDDVRTTGATLAACSEKLQSMGARVVSTLVLARDV